MSDYLRRHRHHRFCRLNQINWEVPQHLWRNWWNFLMAYSLSVFAILHMTKTKPRRRCGSSIRRNDYRICSHTTSLIFDQMRIEWSDDILFGWHGLISLEREWYWEILGSVGYCNSLLQSKRKATWTSWYRGRPTWYRWRMAWRSSWTAEPATFPAVKATAGTRLCGRHGSRRWITAAAIWNMEAHWPRPRKFTR